MRTRSWMRVMRRYDEHQSAPERLEAKHEPLAR
jgi:hypothetical protein